MQTDVWDTNTTTDFDTFTKKLANWLVMKSSGSVESIFVLSETFEMLSLHKHY